jgi:site-specific DNA-methyltransferase (adenine-specific)
LGPAASDSQLVPSEAEGRPPLPSPIFRDDKHHLRIYQGDSLEILAALPESSIDLIFADPPYFLSNNAITCHAGRMVSVNKGSWDRSRGPDANHAFNRAWLAACQRLLKPNGSLSLRSVRGVHFARPSSFFSCLGSSVPLYPEHDVPRGACLRGPNPLASG